MNKFVLILIPLLFCSCASNVSFDESKTALLIIDIQNAYLPVYDQGVFIPNVSSLLKEARKKEVLIIHVRNLDGYNKEGSYGWKFHGAVKPVDGEIIIEKEYASSFSGTELESILQSKEIETLVLTGLASSHCYAATVREAMNKGYKTVVVKDGHADQIKGRSENLNNLLEGKENVLLLNREEIRF